MNELLTHIEQLVNEHLPPDNSVYVVALKIKPTHNIKLYVDTDTGITIEHCIKLNRKLYAAIEEKGLFVDGDFSLEVSSPGVGEPILLNRQYIKNVGRWLEVDLKDGNRVEGQLLSAALDYLELEVTTGKGKKQTIHTQQISYDAISKAVVAVKF